MDYNWLTLGGNELVNTARARAYAAGGAEGAGCGGGAALVGCGCPGLDRAVEGEDFPGYVDPVADPAPWYDPTFSESADFLGVVGLDAEGLGTGTMVRNPTALASGGAHIGVQVPRHREITYRVQVVGRTQAGAAYGVSWLTAALRGVGCTGGDCWGQEACVFAWCPDGPEDGDRAQRTMFDVGLLEGPETTEVFRSGAGVWYREVEFTLAVGNPWLFTSPYVELPWRSAVRDVVRVPAGGPGGDCPEPDPCRSDPDCPAPDLPPLPPQPVDPCWPLTGFQANRAVFSIPPGGVPGWFQTVPVVRVWSAGDPLRRVSVRFYANPTGVDCSKYTDRCLACGEANFSWVPGNSVLTLDARRRRVEVDCSAGRGLAVSEPIPYGPGGGLFAWPVIECASGLCIEVMWQREGSSGDARAEVDMVARMGAV